MKDQPKTRYTLNRHRLLEKLQNMMESRHGVTDYDPVVHAVDLAETAYKDGDITSLDLAGIHLNVAPYIHPKVRTIQINGGEDSDGVEKPVRLQLVEKLKAALD